MGPAPQFRTVALEFDAEAHHQALDRYLFL
jgi:hypothetical protein